VLRKKCGMEWRFEDFSENIGQFAGAAKLKDLQNLSVRLEEGLEMLGRNVNVSTIMTSIFYEIYDTYRH